MRVAIIGAGAAGSFLAYLLAANQVSCVVYEGRADKEKPCGGGCTPKAIQRHRLFSTASIRKSLVHDLRFDSTRKHGVSLRLRDPLWIYSRRELDGFLLQEALHRGAGLIREGATGFRRQSGTWQVEDAKGNREPYSFLVGADGAGSLVRKKLCGSFSPSDLSIARGCYLPGTPHPGLAYIRFVDPHLPGYLWAFPRCDHVSVGALAAGRNTSTIELDQLLRQFLKDLYGVERLEGLVRYAAPIPTLSVRTLRRQQTGGRDWALIGDAAGFVDPLTAEGIAYAWRSAELLAGSLVEGVPEDYSRAAKRDFGRELLHAALLRDVFYKRKLGGKSFIDRMLSLTVRSQQVRDLQDDYVAGRVGYAALFSRLLWKSPHILTQILGR